MTHGRVDDDLGCKREIGLLLRLVRQNHERRALRANRQRRLETFDTQPLGLHWVALLRALRDVATRRERPTARARLEPEFRAAVRQAVKGYEMTDRGLVRLAGHPILATMPSLVVELAATRAARQRVAGLVGVQEKRPSENRLRAAFTASVAQMTGELQDALVAACLRAALERNVDEHSQRVWRERHTRELRQAEQTETREALLALWRLVGRRDAERGERNG